MFSSKWFAYYPIRVGINKKWVWFSYVEKIEDHRTESYLGMLPSIYYEEIKETINKKRNRIINDLLH